MGFSHTWNHPPLPGVVRFLANDGLKVFYEGLAGILQVEKDRRVARMKWSGLVNATEFLISFQRLYSPPFLKYLPCGLSTHLGDSQALVFLVEMVGLGDHPAGEGEAGGKPDRM